MRGGGDMSNRDEGLGVKVWWYSTGLDPMVPIVVILPARCVY